MTEIREIAEGQTALGAPAVLELRPRWHTVDAVTRFIDTRLRPCGYRLVGAFVEGSATAVAVAGFREVWSTAFGHHLYVDDVVTLPGARTHGHADLLMRWLKAEAGRLCCEAVHLDSGVGADRAAAHRLYMRHHLRITAYHFATDVTR